MATGGTGAGLEPLPDSDRSAHGPGAGPGPAGPGAGPWPMCQLRQGLEPGACAPCGHVFSQERYRNHIYNNYNLGNVDIPITRCDYSDYPT